MRECFHKINELFSNVDMFSMLSIFNLFIRRNEFFPDYFSNFMHTKMMPKTKLDGLSYILLDFENFNGQLGDRRNLDTQAKKI